MRSKRVIVVKNDRFTRTLLVVIAALLLFSYLRDAGVDIARFGRVAIGLKIGSSWKTAPTRVLVENSSFDVEVTNTPTVELDEPVEVRIR